MRAFLDIPYELRQYIYQHYLRDLTVKVVARPLTLTQDATAVVYPFTFVFEEDVDHNAVVCYDKTITNCRTGRRVNLTLLGSCRFVRLELMTLLSPTAPLEINVSDLMSTYQIDSIRHSLPRCLPHSYTRHVRHLDVDIEFLRNFTDISSRFKSLQKLTFRDQTYTMDGVSQGRSLSWISQRYPFDYMRRNGWLQECAYYKLKFAKNYLAGHKSDDHRLSFELEYIGWSLGYNDTLWGYNYKGHVLYERAVERQDGSVDIHIQYGRLFARLLGYVPLPATPRVNCDLNIHTLTTRRATPPADQILWSCRTTPAFETSHLLAE